MTAPSSVQADLLAAMQASESARYVAEFDAARKAADAILDTIIKKHERNMLAIYEARPTIRTPIRVAPALALPDDLDAEPSTAQPAAAPDFGSMTFGKPA